MQYRLWLNHFDQIQDHELWPYFVYMGNFTKHKNTQSLKRKEQKKKKKKDKVSKVS